MVKLSLVIGVLVNWIKSFISFNQMSMGQKYLASGMP